MTHIAIYGEQGGQSAHWMEKVSDGQYLANSVNSVNSVNS